MDIVPNDIVLCDYCRKWPAAFTCGHNCRSVVYCGTECALNDYANHIDPISFECISVGPGDQNVRQEYDWLNAVMPVKVVGEGAFGLVLVSSDGKYAIKVQETSHPEWCDREANIHREIAGIKDAAVTKLYFSSSNITQIKPRSWRNVILKSNSPMAATWARKNWQGKFCIQISDFVQRLSPAQRTLNMNEMNAVAFQLIFTITYAHSKIGFQHLDLHTGNILLLDNPSGVVNISVPQKRWHFTNTFKRCVIIDFGFSVTNTNRRRGPMGGAQILPPTELCRLMDGVLEKQPKFTSWEKTYDHWSIGVSLYNMAMHFKHKAFRMDHTSNDFLTASMKSLGIEPKMRDFITPMFKYLSVSMAMGNTNINFFAKVPGKTAWALLASPTAQRHLKHLLKQTKVLLPEITLMTKTFGPFFTNLLKRLLSFDPVERNVLDDGKTFIQYHPYFESKRVNAAAAAAAGNRRRA